MKSQRSSERGVSELIVVALITALIIVATVALLPGFLASIASEETRDSAGVDKEAVLCSGDDCTDCVPGQACHSTSTVSTTSGGPGPGPGCGGCFVGETLVWLANGNILPISEIRVGDMVLSLGGNPETAQSELVSGLVTKVFVHENSDLLRVRVDQLSIDTTSVHPFYVVGKGWTAAGLLEEGDVLITAGGEEKAVRNITALSEKEVVYNLHVEGSETYFVTEEGVLVHNKDQFSTGCGPGAPV